MVATDRVGESAITPPSLLVAALLVAALLPHNFETRKIKQSRPIRVRTRYSTQLYSLFLDLL